MKNKLILSKHCKCCVCKKAKAIAFWPCIDPDIAAKPYCRKCLDKIRLELIRDLSL